MATLYYLTKDTFCPGFIKQTVNKPLCNSRPCSKTNYKYWLVAQGNLMAHQ